MSATIQLTQGMSCLVDEADYPMLVQLRWHASRLGARNGRPGHVYAMTGRNVMMHNLLMCPPAGMQVDHINRDTLDNRRSNLRVVTHAQNCMNRLADPGSTSSYKGVSRSGNRWVAMLGKTCLGRFDSEIEAARAYDAAAARRYGPPAFLNFPDEAAAS